MLIYEWTPFSSSSTLRLAEGKTILFHGNFSFLISVFLTGFAFNLTRYKGIVLSVVYKKEKEVHKEQSGVVLYIGTKV